MVSERLINRFEESLTELAEISGSKEKTSIVTNLQVIDAAPAGLTDYIIVEDSKDGDYITAVQVPGMVYANGDLVNVLFIEGTEPIAYQHASGSGGVAFAVDRVYDSAFSSLAGQSDANGNFIWNNWQAANANGFIVKNTSGATVAAGDCGYIDASREFQTTTTAEDEQVQPVFVVQGGANNADIYVTEAGRLTVNYVGGAPSIGDYLTFSATAGSVQARSTFHPSVIAYARAAGAGGTVEADLLCRSVPQVIGFTNDLYQINTTSRGSDSDFVALIDSLPGGAAVRYDTPTSGDELNLVPQSTSQIVKMVLHNTTRGDSALILDCDTTGGAGYDGEITLTDIVPGTWAATDTITIRSQTNTSTIATTHYFVDFEIVSEIHDLARVITAEFMCYDTGAAGEIFRAHPFETNSNSKRRGPNNTASGVNQQEITLVQIPLIQKRFCVNWGGSGTGTCVFRLRPTGQIVAT